MDGLTVLILSIAVGFGYAESVDTSQCHQIAVQKELYQSLHKAITEHAIGFTAGTKHIALLDSGLRLDYSDFNPGKRSRFTPPGTLPLAVVENSLPIVDRIFPSGSVVVTNMSANTTTNQGGHTDSLSSTFDFILNHMMVTPRNFSDEVVLRAKYYLQELVPNPERVVLNQTELPRYLLYDYYKALYLDMKFISDAYTDANRSTLTQAAFQRWSLQNSPELQSKMQAAFNKWQIFGYKDEVEKELQYLDVNSHDDHLTSSRALFYSMAKHSERDAHTMVFPITFKPIDWYRKLRESVSESSGELQYKRSLLLAQQALMNATREELSSDTSKNIDDVLKLIETKLRELRQTIQNAVDKILQMEVDCFTMINLTACAEISNGNTYFRFVIQETAEHFSQAGYLESLLRSKNESIQVLSEKLIEVATKIKLLEERIEVAERIEIEEIAGPTAGSTQETVSCPETGHIHFTFDSKKDTFVDPQLCDLINAENNDPEKVKNFLMCSDDGIRIPVNVTRRPLWNLQSCAVDNELMAFTRLSNFTKLMNAVNSKVTASLLKVDIERSWLDSSLFDDENHFTMKKNRGIVSPGPLVPEEYFYEVVAGGDYLLPQYPSSFILASNIQVFFPTLGSWNDSDSENDTNVAINILMKYTYAATLTGGYGPFTFAPVDGARTDAHSFRVERKNGGLLLSIPGAQVIGYIMTVVPKFPVDQPDSPEWNGTCHADSVHNSERRKRRSISTQEQLNNDPPVGIKELAHSFFSESFPRNPAHSQSGSLPIAASLEKLMHDTDATNERLLNFLNKIDGENGNTEDGPTVLPISSPGESYKNETIAHHIQL